MQKYLIVDGTRAAVDRYHRAHGEAGEEWDLTRCTAGALRLDCLDAELPLAEIYADVPELAAAVLAADSVDASADAAEKSTSA